LPDGWSVTTGSGVTHLNLTTLNVVDSLGRTAITVDPNNDAMIIAMDDLHHETRVYTGWKYTGSSYVQDTSSTLPPV
jgi:hypothetical protein